MNRKNRYRRPFVADGVTVENKAGVVRLIFWRAPAARRQPLRQPVVMPRAAYRWAVLAMTRPDVLGV